MAKKGGEHPHLAAWTKNFSKSVGKSSINVLKSVTPNISDTVISASESMRSGRDYLLHSKSSMNFQSRTLDNTKLGRSAKDILDSAFSDIKTGNFSLNKLNDDSFNFDDKDTFGLGEIDLNDPASIATQETRKNTAVLGSIVAEGNSATISGLRTMTDTLARVTVKSSEASASKLANVTLFGMNRISADMMNMQKGIVSINNNLVAMIKFQNENVSKTNQAAINYYDTSSRMLYEMGKTLSEIKDHNEQMKEMTNKRDNSNRDNFLYSGMDFRGYGKHIKNNFNNSIYGMIPMMIGMYTGQGIGGMGGSPRVAEKALELALSKILMPKSVKKSLGNTDKNFNQLMKNAMYKLGDMGDDYSNPLKQFFGEMFGMKRPKMGTANMGNFKKDAMGWNGVAQKTLVEIIPSYLANIESAITRQEKRYYDMDRGVFKTKSTLKKEYNEDYQFKVQMGMYSTTEKLAKELEASKSKDKDKIKNSVNDLLNERVTGKRGYDKDYIKEMNSLLNGTMPTKQIRNIMLDLEDSIRDTVKAVNEFNESIEDGVSGSAYRNLFNTNGKDQSRLRGKASLFGERAFSSSGRAYSHMTAEEIRKDKERLKQEKELKSKWKKFSGRFNSGTRGDKMASKIDGFNDMLYNASMQSMGMDEMGMFQSNTSPNGFVMRDPKIASSRNITGRMNKAQSDIKRMASSRASKKAGRTGDAQSAKLTHALSIYKSMDYKKEMNATPEEINNDMKAGIDVLDDMKPGIDEDKSSIKALIHNLFTSFLKPVAGLFGKNGIVKGMMQSDQMKEGLAFMNKKLFDEKTGMFGGLVSQLKDGVDYLKYAFTGKGYTNRKGKKYADNKNSVLNHLTDGYDFFFKNTMVYLFGDEFKSNGTFKKYFQWLDFKGKKKKDGESETETAPGAGSKKAIPRLGFNDDAKETRKSSSMKRNRDQLALPDKSSGDLMLPSVQETSLIRSKMELNLIDSTAEVGERIRSNGQKFSEVVFGDENQTPEKAKEIINEAFTKKMKHNFPRMLAAGIAGAGAVALTGGSLGVLGGLFLPNSIIGGALAGMGLQIASKSQKFQEFVFGKSDKEGNKTGGMISKKTQAAFKKAAPLIVGAGVLGGLKNLVFGSSMISSTPVGFMMGALLPGGVIGGALLGTGIALLRNSETFNKILFGKSPNNPDGHKGILAKGMGKVTKAFVKSKNFVKGGLKGMGAGVLAGATIGQMGVLGSALTLGGPIGAGIAGLGLGIASQTQRFQELLFGTKEIGKDGKPTGKTIKNGIMDQVRNMLVIKIFDPVKLQVEKTMTNFAFWAKKQIEYPFRLAFGPILDSLYGVKESITDIVKDKFEALTDGIGKAFKDTIKKVFSPITMVLGKIGKLAVSSIGLTAKMTGSIVSSPLKFLSLLTSPTRAKENIKFVKDSFMPVFGKEGRQSMRDHWRDQEESGAYGTGISGKLKSLRSKVSDVKNAYGTARESYNNVMSVNGMNHLNHRGVYSERRQTKIDEKERKDQFKNLQKIQKQRQLFAKEDHHKEIFWTDKRIKERQKKFKSLGVNEDWIKDPEDLRNLIFNYDDWKEKFQPKKMANIDGLKPGMTFQETPEQEAARKKTEHHQDITEGWLAKIYDAVAIKAEERAEKTNNTRRRKHSEKDLRKFKSKLDKAGLSFEDLNLAPEEMVDYQSLSPMAWEEYRDSEFAEAGDFKGWYKLYGGKYFNGNEYSVEDELKDRVKKASFFNSPQLKGHSGIKNSNPLRSQAVRNSQSYTQNDDSIVDVVYSEVDEQRNTNEILNDIADVMKGVATNIIGVKDTTSQVVTAVAEGNEIRTTAKYNSKGLFNGRAGMSDRDIKAFDKAEDADDEKKQKSSLSSALFSVFKKTKKSDAEDNRDSKEKTETEHATGLKSKLKGLLGIGKASSSETKSDDTEDKGNGILGKAFGIVGNIFSGVTGFLSDSGRWGKFGMAALMAYTFRDKLKPLIGSIGDTVSGLMEKYLEPTLNAVGDFTAKYGPMIINGMADTITVLAPALVTNAFKIAGAFGGTLIDMGKNALGLSAQSKTVTAEEAAKLEASGVNAIANEDGTYRVLGSRTYLDDSGNAQKITNGNIYGRSARLAVNMIGNEKTAANVGKTIAGTLTLPTKLLPGGKIISRAAENGAANVLSHSASAINAGIGKLESRAAKTAKSVFGGKSAKVGAEIIGDSVKEGNAGKVTAWFASFLKKFEKIGSNSKITKLVNASIFKNIITKFKSLIGKIVTTITPTKAAKISPKLADAAQAVVKGGSKLIPVIGWVMIGVDAVNGLLEADKLFGVPSDEVDWTMRTVSSLMKVILGLGIGPLFDIAIEVLSELSNQDLKQDFATMVYNCIKTIAGDEDAIARLNENQENLKTEVANYNEANDTNLTQTAYKDLKNSPWYKDAWNWMSGKKAEDFSKYEAKNYKSTAKVSTTTTTTTTNTGYAALTNQPVTAEPLGYGSGPGYGTTGPIVGLSQKDARWGNYPLGTFPDGSTSTMATGGCGPTALAMAASSIKNQKYDPASIAQFAQSNGYIADGGATEDLFTTGASKLGLKANRVSGSDLRKSLLEKNPVIVAGKSGSGSANTPYTKAGHILTASSIDSKDNVVISDPNYGGSQTVKLSSLTSGLTHAWKYSKNAGYGIGAAPAPAPTPIPQSVVSSSGSVALPSPSRSGVITPEASEATAKASGILASHPYLPGSMQANMLDDMNRQMGLPSYYEGLNVKRTGYTVQKTDAMIKALYDRGFKSNANMLTNWDNPAFYTMSVKDLKRLYKLDTDGKLSNHPLFSEMYKKVTTTKGYSDSSLLSPVDAISIMPYLSMANALGKSFTAENGVKYKNGIPFYALNDPDWAGMPWAGSTMSSTGSDIASLGMIMSAYSKNGLTPKYIYNNWLAEHPEWYDESTGLKPSIFSDGGANSRTETRAEGAGRLKMQNVSSPASIISAMKSKRLVYMKGYPFGDSAFGGIGDASSVDVQNTKLNTVVGTYAKNGVIAIADPATDYQSYSLFPESILSAKVGPKGDTLALKSATIVSNADNSGLAGNVDIANMTLPESKYKSIAEETTLFGKMSAGIGNMVGIVENLLASALGGTSYQSIHNETLANSGTDTVGNYDTSETEAGGDGETSAAPNAKIIPGGVNNALANPKSQIASIDPSEFKFGGLKTTGKAATSKLKNMTYLPVSNNGGSNTITPFYKQSEYNPEKIWQDSVGHGIGYGKGIGYGTDNPLLKLIFGIDNGTAEAASPSGIIDDGIKPSGYSSDGQDFLGKYVAQFESGTSGPTAVSTGKGDRGGVSFGTYQLASFGKAVADSNLKTFWNKYYGSKYPNAIPGQNNSFIETWKSEARRDPDAFHANEQDFMYDEYYQPQKNVLHGVVDPDTHSRSAQESTWSTAIQYGAHTHVIKDALKDKESQSMGVKALINTIQNEKVRRLAAKGKKSQRHNVGERNVLLNIANLPPLATGGGNASLSALIGGHGSLKSRSVGYGTVSADTARSNLVSLMTSFENQLHYSKDVRNPERGSADCSSTVQYCYKKVCNIDIGSNTNAQITSSKGIDVDIASPGSAPNESKLKIGDLLYYRNPNSGYANKVGHVEMYVGNGKCMGHGGPDYNDMGPNFHTLSSYRTKKDGGRYYLKARRFIKDGTDIEVSGVTSAGGTASGTGMFGVLNSMSTAGSSLTNILNPLFEKVAGYDDSVIGNSLGTSIGNGSGSLTNKTPESWFKQTLGGEVTGKYGLGYGLGGFHRGIDIGADEGSTIMTPISGRVVANGNDPVGYGNHLVIRGDDGKNHLFAHMNAQSPYGIGSRVNAKSSIGYVGSTGNSNGNHLHYEIRKGDSRYSAIDPASYKYGSEAVAHGSKNVNDKMVSRSQNINRLANSPLTEPEFNYGTGGADTNFTTSDAIKKLNVAVNTTGVENKLDILIGVMKTWAQRDSEKGNNSTTKVIAYGSGDTKNTQPKVTVVNNTKSNQETKDYSNMSLRNIHNTLAKARV